MPQLVYLTEDIILAVVKEALGHGWTIENNASSMGSLVAPKEDVRLGWCTEWITCKTLNIRVPMYLFCVKKDEQGKLRTVFFTKDGNEIIRGEIK